MAGLSPRWEGRTGQQLSPGTPSVSPEDAAVKGRLVECLETVLNKAQEPPKSKKVQHSNAKNAILFETISLIIHYDRCPGRGEGGACWPAGWRHCSCLCSGSVAWVSPGGSETGRAGGQQLSCGPWG